MNWKRLSRVYLFSISLLILIAFNSCNKVEEQRIISLSPSHSEVLYALGLGNQIVGWTKYCNYPPEVQDVPGWLPYDKYEFKSIEDELIKNVAVVSAFTQVNYELIDSLKPTLILSVHQMQREIANVLRNKGYNVLHFEPKTLDDVFTLIETVAKATGKEKVAERLVKEYRKEIKDIKAITKDLPKVKVYFEINHNGPYALGAGSPMDQIIDFAGGVNIFEDVKRLAFKPSLDEIIKRNPDVILTPLWPHAGRDEVTTVREIVVREGFENIEAIKNDRVYHYDSCLLKKPGPRQVTAIKKLAYLLHPYYCKNPENSVDPWELGKIDETYPPIKPLR